MFAYLIRDVDNFYKARGAMLDTSTVLFVNIDKRTSLLDAFFCAAIFRHLQSTEASFNCTILLLVLLSELATNLDSIRVELFPNCIQV